MEFNINNTVKVKLTERGVSILRERHEDWYRRSPNIGLKEFTPPPTDENGYSTFQMWHLMETFGPHIYLGCNLPFDASIKIDPKHLAEEK